MTRRMAIAALGLLAVSCRGGRGLRTSTGRFRAFSLREAQRRLERHSVGHDVKSLAGLTRTLGLVRDAGDLIIVGSMRTGAVALSLDDLVAALRARFARRQWPLVSIDKTPDSAATGQQAIRLEGVSNDGFAAKLLAADLFLKNAGLGRPPADRLPVRSFFELCEDAARRGMWSGHVSSRLWFHVRNASLLVRPDMVAIRDLTVGVRSEVTSGAEGSRDETSDAYAEAFTRNLPAIAAAYPQEVGQLKPLFDFVGLTRGLESIERIDLDYWMTGYQLPLVAVPDRIALISRTSSIETNGQKLTLEVNGGVDTQMLRVRLTEGDHEAFRDAVLRSRPEPHALSWPVPLGGWRFAGPEGEESSAPERQSIGSHFDRQILMSPAATDQRNPRGGVTTAVTVAPSDFVRKP